MRFRKARANGSSSLRLFFATDIHGSELCWRKLLRCGDFYSTECVVIGGDMTGKAVVPIVSSGNGSYRTYLQEQRHDFEGKSELERYKRMIRDRGLYPFQVTEDDVAALQESPDEVDAIFRRLIRCTLEEWIALADKELAGSNVRLYVCPGNDDFFEIDEILRDAERVILCEGRVIDLDETYQLVSTGWSNRTPWATEREEDEPALASRIQSVLNQITVVPERVLFNFHCPPHGTSLDEAPELTDDLKVVGGGKAVAHVGSTAVREAIERVQPIVSLHGHIHESRATARIGRTLAVNPGSSYETGVLFGAVIDVTGEGKLKQYRLTAG
jgi:Icc-related predicted phosphoesterase